MGVGFKSIQDANDGMFDRALDDYIDSPFKNTVMFSTLPPDEISDQLITLLINKNAKIEINEKKWKITFTLKRDLENKEQEAQTHTESCTVQVKLLKMDKVSEKICIEFTRKSGSLWYFLEQFKELKD